MATVRFGAFLDSTGKVLAEPITARTFYLWIHWDEDPGEAFTAAHLTSTVPTRTIQIIARKNNSFLFLIGARGQEGNRTWTIAANIFGNNKAVTKTVRWMSYDARLRNWVVPTSTATTKTITVTTEVARGRPHFGINRRDFSLVGIVNGLPYEHKDDILSAGPEQRSNALGKVITISIRLPVNSKGTLRIRLDAFSIYTSNPEAGKAYGPLRDYYSPTFDFDTTSRSSPTIERGIEGTVAATHEDGATITAIDHVLDIRDDRWFLPPINEIEWRVDQNSFRNQITINFEDGGKPYYEEDEESISLYGGSDFQMTVPLERSQTTWVKWIARTFLQANATPKFIANLDLVNSLYLELGDVLYLRQKENPGVVVQVTSLNHDFRSLRTQARVVRIR